MPSPRVSIIVPIYNSEDFIERCLKSIQNQTYRNIEILLVDDGSSDGSLKLCHEFQSNDERIKVYSQSNQGVSSARNLGIDAASGEYVAFVDSDDWIDANAIENMLRVAINNRVTCVRTHYDVDKGNGNFIHPKIGLKTGLVAGDDMAVLVNDLLLSKDNCYVVLLLISKEVLDRHKLKFTTDLSMMEDVVFYFDLLSKLDGIYISDFCTYHYTWNPQSASKSMDRLVENARMTIEVSGYLDNKILSLYPSYIDDFKIRDIHAVQLSMICSRILTATLSSRTLTLAEVKKYIESIHNLPGFDRLTINSNTSNLKGYLRYSVYFMTKRHPMLLYLILRLRVFAVQVRMKLRG